MDYQRIMNKTWAALVNSNLPPVARLTLLAILKECSSQASAEISLDNLVRKVGACKRTLQTTAFPKLIEGGWITIKHTPNYISTYTIVNTEFLG